MSNKTFFVVAGWFCVVASIVAMVWGLPLVPRKGRDGDSSQAALYMILSRVCFRLAEVAP